MDQMTVARLYQRRYISHELTKVITGGARRFHLNFGIRLSLSLSLSSKLRNCVSRRTNCWVRTCMITSMKKTVRSSRVISRPTGCSRCRHRRRRVSRKCPRFRRTTTIPAPPRTRRRITGLTRKPSTFASRDGTSSSA